MEDEQARDELRARQGVGARYDAETAPVTELVWARRGTAYLARKLNELADDDLDQLGRGGVSRRIVIARIAYQARALAQMLEGLRTHVEKPMPGASGVFDSELVDARTLPAHALRYLFAHSEIHLNVEWRDLPDEGWSNILRHVSGWAFTPADTVLLRARTVWGGALALGNGARIADVPADLTAALAQQAGRYWQAQGLSVDLPRLPADLARGLLGAQLQGAAELPPLPEFL